MEVADQLGAHTVAFPAISTGVYGYPADEAAAIAVDTLHLVGQSTVEHVLLVAFDRATFERYESLLSAPPI
jgi:O-acetyl-ADP-ribose deacetylase (regulator of RNase III)